MRERKWERERDIRERERERERLGFNYRAFLIYRALITLGDERLQQKLKVNKLKIKHLQEETVETRFSWARIEEKLQDQDLRKVA